MVVFEEAFFGELQAAVQALEAMLMIGLVRADLKNISIENWSATATTMHH